MSASYVPNPSISYILSSHRNDVVTWLSMGLPLSRGHVSGVIFEETVSGAIRPPDACHAPRAH